MSNTLCNDELDIKRKELEIRVRELNLRLADFLLEMLNNPPFPITPETRTVFAHEAFRLVSGHDCLLMLPESTDKYYTATELGQLLGISVNKVERIANAQGIKPPEGESNDFGLWIYSKSQYSSREVSSFIYSEYALEWFKRHEGTA